MEIRYRRLLNKLLTLYELPMIAAEIGVAEGLFSRDMLTWGLDLLYCVDNWAHIPHVKGDGNSGDDWHSENEWRAKWLLEKWHKEEKVIYLKGLSVDMASRVPDDQLGLLYLDADHSYAGVKSDLNAWYEKVIPGGIIAGHDYLNPSYGVKDAIQEFCKNRFDVHVMNEDKKEDAGFWFRKVKF